MTAENLNGSTPIANQNTDVQLILPPTRPANVNAVTRTVVVPVENFFSRITKKPFDLYVTPKNSPVTPEKFTGYHTGVDAETTPDEQSIDVAVFAIADGEVVFAGHVNGYGGVLIIRSIVNNETVTVLYGHVRLSSVTLKKGNTVKVGARIAVLGNGFSSETDGERKHLHLGIIRGGVVNYRGYVSKQADLSGWLDPVAWLHEHGV